MFRMSKVESRTQEIIFLASLGLAVFVGIEGFFYLNIPTDDLPRFTGYMGADALEFLFNNIGYAFFFLSVSLFFLGQYTLLKVTQFTELLRYTPKILLQVLIQVATLTFLASLITVFQNHFALPNHMVLAYGGGGTVGQFIGGSLYSKFGVLGSNFFLLSALLSMGILSDMIHLTDIYYWAQNVFYAFSSIFKSQMLLLLTKTSSLSQHLFEMMVGRLDLVVDVNRVTGGMFEPRENLKQIDKELLNAIEKISPDIPNYEEASKEVNLEGEAAKSKGEASSETDMTELKKKKRGRPKKKKGAENENENSQTNTNSSTSATSAKKQANTETPDEDISSPPVEEDNITISPWKGRYTKPSLDLLKKFSLKSPIKKTQLAAQTKELEERLASFKVEGKVIAAYCGPRLTMYEFQPAPGIKVSRISGLANDLALVLGAESIRILTPIPGKSTVGIEVPHPNPQPVPLADLIKRISKDSPDAVLPIALGYDIENKAIIADIDEMPHLLISGTTGSGKSVFINTLITNLLFSHSPQKLRFLMIDPKMIELSPYNGIPHLLKPVITDVNEAKDALVWTQNEMDVRYQQFAQVGARNIASFNEIVKTKTKVSLERRMKSKLDWEWAEMPQIVVIIDELADLMITQGKDVEIPITRIAQKARSAGIHLVVATQRPSAEIVTGLIKTNFPTRVAFKVSSNIDSRTILDASGAEKLLGKGDMLYMPNGKALKRIQASFISENEVKKIVQSISKK